MLKMKKRRAQRGLATYYQDPEVPTEFHGNHVFFVIYSEESIFLPPKVFK